jgi:hypothetical protein
VTNRFLSCAAAGSLAAVLSAGGARAEGEATTTVRLVWEAEAGTEGCLTRAELEKLVEVELERAVFVADEAPATRVIRVRLGRDAEKGGFRALVTSESPGGDAPRSEPGVERELAARECRDIDEPLALVVALLADADESPPPETKQEALPPPEPEPEVRQDEIQPLGPVTTAPGWEAAQRDARWSYELDIAGAVGVGMLPHVGGGGELGFLAEPPSFPSHRLRVVGLTSAPAEPVPGATVSFVYGMAGVSLCPTIARFSGATLRFCAGVDVGLLYARSEGLEESTETTEFFGQADLAFRGTLKLGGGFLGTLGVGVVFPTKVDRFVYTQDGETKEIFQMAFVPFLATIGVAYEIL